MEAKDIALYFLSKDAEKKVFNENLVLKNDRKFYDGNARLNKYLFFAQTVYLGKNGKLLFKDDFVAYDNGPVVKEILENYRILSSNRNQNISLDEKIKSFLDKLYASLIDATTEELIEITHEDTAWKEHKEKTSVRPKIDLLKYKKKYEEQYKGIIKVLDL
jgi:uncharacterized phage-associated protein